ncbi:alpha/beta hydrolase [Rhodospirillaceae bacterium SYSU D60014]|uniref:alpha/beta hydrolase n=1 Tax=Virgifigura deserti TaxID=2268457 RepID=UPI000E668F62
MALPWRATLAPEARDRHIVIMSPTGNGVRTRRMSLAAVLPVLLLVAGCSPTRFAEAGRVLADMAAGDAPSALKEATPAPQRRGLSYEVDGRRYRADLHLPADAPPAATLLLVPGLAPAGKDDPRLVAFATTLARARFAVLVPDLASLRALRVSAANRREIADAIAFLQNSQAGIAPEPIGVAAISYAVGPALLATLDTAPGEPVDFFVGIGGYYHIEAAITFFTTGYYRESPGGPWRYRRPNAYGKWVFVGSNAARLDSPRDRRLLTAMARRRQADLDSDIADLAARLGPEGRAVYRLITNRDPDRVPALIAALPAGLRADLEALDLSGRALSDGPRRLILLHGRDDRIIPASESAALADAFPQDRAELYLVDNLAHAELGPGDWLDGVTLLRAVYALLELRDAEATAELSS